MKCVAAFCALVLVGCSSSSSGGTTAPGSDGGAATPGGASFSCKVNGNDWVGIGVTGAWGKGGLPKDAAVVGAKLDTASSQSIDFNLYEILGPGTYTGTNQSDVAKFAAQFLNNDEKKLFAGRYLATNNRDGESFTITFTKLDGLDLEGTFGGTLTNDDGSHQLVITDGRFDTLK